MAARRLKIETTIMISTRVKPDLLDDLMFIMFCCFCSVRGVNEATGGLIISAVSLTDFLLRPRVGKGAFEMPTEGLDLRCKPLAGKPLVEPASEIVQKRQRAAA